MLLSSSFIRSLINTPHTDEEIAELLNLSGIETNIINKEEAAFSGVVVAKVIKAQKHPNADKLKLCEVFDGTDTFQIVCGADNARDGIFVAMAKVGAVLPNNFKIKRSKIRGIESDGMLCSYKELELGEDASGIIELDDDLSLGQNVIEALKLNDNIFEFEITPNRSDCLSAIGIAREIASLSKQTIVKNKILPKMPFSGKKLINVELLEPKGASKYCVGIVENVDVNKPTPPFIKNALAVAGILERNLIVDIVNYVMLKMGQPMHAFDLDQIHAPINVRYSVSGEEITLLNQCKVTLDDSTLVIADKKNILALAGIMGSLDSATTEKTRNILIESAFFSPIYLARKARSYSLNTEASHRFERFVDPNLAPKALEYALHLIYKYSKGVFSKIQSFKSIDNLPQNKPIILKHERVKKVLGFSVSKGVIAEVLEMINCQYEFLSDSWKVTPPSYRNDLKLEIDLIEEVARIIGYNNIESKPINIDLKFDKNDDTTHQHREIMLSLTHHGFNEVINYSFINEEFESLFNTEEKILRLSNPINQNMNVMRSSVIPSLVENIRFNLHRQSKSCRFYEYSRVFSRQNNKVVQEPSLAAALLELPRKTWNSQKRPDFYFLKEILFSGLGIWRLYLDVVKIDTALPGYFHPNQSASIINKKTKKVIGHIGSLHANLYSKFDLPVSENLWMFELKTSIFSEFNPKNEYKKISKFPSVSRDLALVIDKSLDYGDLENIIYKYSGKNLVKITPFDIFPLKELDTKVSMAINLIWNSKDKTLSDGQVDKAINIILEKLENNHSIYLRPEKLTNEHIKKWSKA